MFAKIIGLITDVDGATAIEGLLSAHNGHRQFKQVLKEEWRALYVAQQDRAHLATVAHAPSHQRIHFDPTVNESTAAY
jgi:hypothetical protein